MTNLFKKIADNKIILYNPTTSIDTPTRLQDAINSSTGTTNNPTVITIPEGGLTLSAPIKINGKYIKLTGGTIKAGFTTNQNLQMFIVESGALILENIILDGGNATSDYVYCTFVHLIGGDLIMDKGAILQHATFNNDYKAVSISKGTFYMREGSIQLNTIRSDGHGQLICIADGLFSMEGGRIYDNIGNGNPIIEGLSNTTFKHSGGSISGNSDGFIKLHGAFYYNTDALIDCPITILQGSRIHVMKKINTSIRINTSLDDGYVLASGEGNYKITDEDLAKFVLPDGYSLRLADNKLILQKETSSGIDTQDKLQAAIDAAQTGSSSSPTLITITSNIEIDKTVVVKGKHIKIAANKYTIYNVSMRNIRMFEVQSGSLTFSKVDVAGGGRARGVYCTFAYVAAEAALYLEDVTIQQTYSSNREDFPLLDIRGICSLKNCVIMKNSGHGLISIEKSGQCTIEGGAIKDNSCFEDNILYGLILNEGNLDYISGDFIGNNSIPIQSIGITAIQSVNIENYFNESSNSVEAVSILIHNNYISLNNNERIRDKFHLYEGYLAIKAAIKREIIVSVSQLNIVENFVVAKGLDYNLTQTDFDKFVLEPDLAKEWRLIFKNNEVVMSKIEETSSEIDTQDKLQAAIDASKGIATAPAEIKIVNKEIPITHSILIKDKYVRLTGGVLKNTASADLRMFDVRSGYLGLTAITLDGNQSKTSGYCTLVEMNGGICEIMAGATLTNALARGGSDAVVVVPQGKLTVKSGDIIGNTSEGGDIVWVSGSGYFDMQGGTIKGNTNNGKYIMAGIQMTGGIMLLNGGQISDNKGMLYGIYATKPFTLGNSVNLKEVVVLSEEAKIQIPSAIKNSVTIGYMKSAIPSGTIVASGSNYKLTDADAKKFSYRSSNKYGFKLDNNNIVLINLDAVNKTFAIKTATIKNGTISASKTTAKENELITVTVKPKAGKKLYTEMLRYNNNRVTATDKANVYTFKMPPADALLTAEFIPEAVNVTPDTGGANPDKDAIPEIDNLPDLIEALKNKGNLNPNAPTDVTPKSSPKDRKELPDPLKEVVGKGEKAGDDFITSLEQLISILSKTSEGKPIKTEILYNLPGKTTLRMYLPSRLIVSERLRAAGTARYYILQENEGEVSRINPVFDAEGNTLTFETNKLGHFVIMNGSSATASEKTSVSKVCVFVDGNRIVIKGLKPGEMLSVYDLSGRLLQREIIQSDMSYYYPKVSGLYIVEYNTGSQKIYFNK